MFGFNLPIWAVASISTVGVPLVTYITGMFLPNGAVKGAGLTVGKLMSVFFRQKIGKNWEKVEGYMQGTISAFIEGLYEGLDFDD